jgi:ribose 5-phosphate isomerase B
MTNRLVAIGADANGYALKTALIEHLAPTYEIRDFGVGSDDDAAPYPAVAFQVAEAVANHEVYRAILICGTGIGMAISANKVNGVRAATAHDGYSIERSVLSNNCQVLALGSLVIGPALAKHICDLWLSLVFDESSASAKKLRVIERYEQGSSPGSLRSEQS